MQATPDLEPRLTGGWRGLVSPSAGPSRLWPRWLFLRGLGLIFFSAFYSLAFQIHGLVGEHGILPMSDFLQAVWVHRGLSGLWLVPSVLWADPTDRGLTILVALGLLSSAALIVNVAPRIATFLCTLLFLGFVAVARAFASYQSDGMLMEAGVLSIFLAPGGLRPGLGEREPPSDAAIVLLLFEWFRIYFGSGVVKLASGDPQWRHLTALDHYYEYGPLPTWIGWYVQHLPHWFHATCAFLVLAIELILPWCAFLKRPFRLAAFAILTPFQVVIILTANYTFLNYLVLLLGVLLLDDAALPRGVPVPPSPPAPIVYGRRRAAAIAFVMGWLLTASILGFPLFPSSILPGPLRWPSTLLAPFRLGEGYGLFARMTEPRYEIELQGSNDAENWIPYPFRYKPQALDEAPGIYAPYQPRFEWNLWFASLGGWRDDDWVVTVEERLLEGQPDVLALFRKDPFHGKPPRYLRAVKWQYFFTDRRTKHETGNWWRREWIGLYCPALERQDDGEISIFDSGPDG